MSATARHLETIAQIGLPAIANLLLAAILFLTIQPTDRTVAPPDLAPPPGPPISVDSGGSLPNASLASLLGWVERATGHHYVCEGPWQTNDGIMNWSCRTTDALVGMRGLDADNIVSVDATWFGFDAGATDLPSWAAATQRTASSEAAAQAWVVAHAGSDAMTGIAGVDLTLAGARGALTLLIARP
jgi:hypothetical protein